MTQYIPPVPRTYQQPPPPPPENRSRQSSTASMNRYHPNNNPSNNYPPPPPLGPTSGSYTAQPPRARAPSFAGTPVPIIEPSTQNGLLGPPTPGVQVPQTQQHPGYPTTPSPQQPPYPSNDYMGRPEVNPRRLSATSAHSRHSHHSGRSHRSHRSSGERRSSGYDRREHRYSDDEREYNKPKRVKSHRPTWGDTVFEMFGVIKSALGPRDKY